MGECQGCSSFQDGHNAHYIAVLRYAPHRPAITGRAVVDAPSGDVMFQPDHDGDGIGPLFNHRPQLIAAALSEASGPCQWIPSLRLLRVPVSTGRAVFSMAREPVEPCPAPRLLDAEFLE